MLVPKLLSTLRGYTRAQAIADGTAGLIVGIVALPLAIAFAIASGVTPERGLWSAIIGGFLISLLGGSRVQIGGPTGAFVVVVYAIVQRHGVDGLLLATLMAGAFLVVLGVARLGAVIKFVPQPVVTGFTSGIAVIIFSTQVKDFLGLSMGAVPADFLAKWEAYASSFHTADLNAAGVALLALLIIVVWPRFAISRKVPGPFVALLAATVLVQVLHLPVETIGSRFGAIASSLPHPRLPTVGALEWRQLVAPAFTIAMLGAIESLLSAVVADGMIGGRHRSNMELVAQGVANLTVPFFGGIPVTGAIARTATNVKSGGRTPVAGMVHALALLLITLFFARWASFIPMAALAAILVVVAYHMSEWRTFRSEMRAPRSDVLVLVATFGLTVFVDLTAAIEVGMVLAAVLFVKRMSEVTNMSVVTRELEDEGDRYATDLNASHLRDVPRGVEIFEINGPFFFGAAEEFKEQIGKVSGRPRVLIIRMRDVPAIDSTGMRALKDVVHRSRLDGTLVLLSDVHSQPLVAMTRSGLLDEIGEDCAFGNLDEALDRARVELGLPPAAHLATATPTVARETPAVPQAAVSAGKSAPGHS
ncbi:MAG: SulP family inorganic anion transporter [Gemmatimonadales bacterium]